MASDPFAFYADAPGAPATTAFSVTPHNTNPLEQVTKALYVGGAGDVALRAVRAGADVIYRNVPAGAYLTVRASHVRAAGTTATNLIGEA